MDNEHSSRKIINFMQEHTFMHDLNHEDYKKSSLKKKKWQELAKELQWGVQETKRKWKALKDSFYREDRKKNLSSEDGVARTNTPWKYYNSLLYLKTSKRHRSTQLGVEINKETQPNLNYSFEDSHKDLVQKIDCSEYVVQDENSMEQSAISDRYYTSNMEDSFEEPQVRKKAKFNKESIIRNDSSQLNTRVESFEQKCKAPAKVKSFFHSVTEIVEEANLSTIKFISLQKKVLEAVETVIKE